MRLLTLLFLTLTLYSCNTEIERNKIGIPNDRKGLKPYQQYAYHSIVQADFDDQGFNESDSFYLWSWDDFGREFNQNRITRTYNNGFYRYTFWTRLNDTALIYAEDSIPSVQLLKDTLFDTNGDGTKDFVATYNPNNGKCPPDFTILFLLDTTSKKFIRISAIEQVPFVKFNPKEKTITSEMSCEQYKAQYKAQYKFRWNKNFKIDTVFSKVSKL